ncbi:hypothetical protein [Streptomyces ziwulingensis]|uniref:Uncharacterized protein n=1 Tax=Streptomyces ziwulingensis TaxID=1045501 RepID=A0ABP9CH38_9ACTN
MLPRLLEPLSRFMSPVALLRRMSHDVTRHEAHLARELARLAEEAGRHRFSRRSRVFHHVTRQVQPEGWVYLITLHPREYRGVPLSVLRRLASAHAFAGEASPTLKDGVTLRSLPAAGSA